ncbi:GNAT family N-acetyltransferase [Candidatus Neomarinimicrobiota bacterium]
MFSIRPEKSADREAISEVNIEAFGQADEANLVDTLRDAGALIISLVAVRNDQVVGHIAFSPVNIASDDGSFTALGLAPMAVLPEHQNQGIGSQLVEAGLKECLRSGHDLVIVLGHAEYYPRFGFVPAGPLGISWDREVPEDAFMVVELGTGVLAGRTGEVKFHPAFDAI